MRGEQFYRSQKKELLLCRKGWTKTRAWKISLHSPFTRFLIESRRKKEEKFPRFPQKGTYPSPSSPPLPPPPSFKPKNNKAKVANEEYSILILFHPSFFRPWTRKRRVYTYAAWDDGGRKGEMSTSVEITRRPVGSDTLTRRCRVLERAHATGRCADWQERPHFTSIAAKIYDSPGGLARP